MGANATPDDVLLAGECLWSVGPGGAAVPVPREFEDAGRAVDTLHAEASAEGRGAQVSTKAVTVWRKRRRCSGVRRSRSVVKRGMAS